MVRIERDFSSLLHNTRIFRLPGKNFHLEFHNQQRYILFSSHYAM